MTSRPIVAARPCAAVVLITLTLIVLLGAAGTVIYLAQLPLPSPVPLVFGPVALGLILWAARTRRWGRLGFGPIPRLAGARTAWLRLALPAFVVLALVAGTTGGVVQQPATAWLGLVGFVLLVAFVEETLFRSVFLAILAPRGQAVAVLVSTAAFALAHAVNVLGSQDLTGTLSQIAFAGAFGLFAACAYLGTGSIWPLIAFHALFDLAQLSGVAQTPLAVDALMTLILLAGAAWLWAGIRSVGAGDSVGAAPAVAVRARSSGRDWLERARRLGCGGATRAAAPAPR